MARNFEGTEVLLSLLEALVWAGVVIIALASIMGAERDGMLRAIVLALPQLVAGLGAAAFLRVARAFLRVADVILDQAGRSQPWPAHRVEDRRGYEIAVAPDGGFLVAGQRHGTIEAARAAADRLAR